MEGRASVVVTAGLEWCVRVTAMEGANARLPVVERRDRKTVAVANFMVVLDLCVIDALVQKNL